MKRLITKYNNKNYNQVYNYMTNYLEFYKGFTITKIINNQFKKEITMYFKITRSI